MKKIISLALLILLCLPVVSFGHSGRTDSQGGHHDYNNVSGLGDYHFHHGYPAHLHPGGVCPYETTNQEVNSNQEESPTYDAEFYRNIEIENEATIAQNNAIAELERIKEEQQKSLMFTRAMIIAGALFIVFVLCRVIWVSRKKE